MQNHKYGRNQTNCLIVMYWNVSVVDGRLFCLAIFLFHMILPKLYLEEKCDYIRKHVFSNDLLRLPWLYGQWSARRKEIGIFWFSVNEISNHFVSRHRDASLVDRSVCICFSSSMLLNNASMRSIVWYRVLPVNVYGKEHICTHRFIWW